MRVFCTGFSFSPLQAYGADPMRVLIDFTQIPLRRAGAGIYAENLVREILDLVPPGDRLFLLIQSDETVLPRLAAERGNVQLISVPAKILRNRVALMLFEQTVLPLLLLVHRIDVVHSLHYTMPLWSPAACVVTFHDLTMVLCPKLHTRGRRLLMPLYMRLAWRLADAVVFVSSATEWDAKRLFAPRTKKCVVVPLGVNGECFCLPGEDESQGRLRELGIDRPFLLHLGTLEPRKNLVRLVRAFEQTASEFPDYLLVLAGKLGWDYAPVLEAMRASRYSDRIRHLGYISEEQKRALLARCAMVAYPSLYEGFGLPVLEAMAAGAPVITSNVSSLPEVAGEAALLISPESVEELTRAMQSILRDGDLAARLRLQGLEQARRFPWSRTGEETYRIYRGVIRRL